MAKRSLLVVLLTGALACSDGPAAITVVPPDTTLPPPETQPVDPVEVARQIVSDSLVRALSEALPDAGLEALWPEIDRAIAGHTVDREALVEALTAASDALADPPATLSEPGHEDEFIMWAALGHTVDRALELVLADA